MKSSRLTKAGVVSLTSQQKQLLLGTLLGDGNLSKPSLRPRYRAIHGDPQKDYLFHKYSILQPLVGTPPKPRVNGGYGTTSWSFTTLTTELFTPFWELCYPNGKKRLSSQWLEQLSTEGLAWLWMDDGSVSRSSGSIHLESMTKEENQLMANWLTARGYEASVSRAKDRYWYVRLNLAGLRKLTQDIQPYVHDSMQYKLEVARAPQARNCPCCGKSFVPKGNQISWGNAVCGAEACLRWQANQRNHRYIEKPGVRETKLAKARERYATQGEAARQREREKAARLRQDPEKRAKMNERRRAWRKARKEAGKPAT